MKLMKQLIIILLMLFLGNFISTAFKVPIPGNVLGMGLLTMALVKGWVKLEDVEDVSGFLLSYLGIFFIPPGVGLMLYFDLISAQWIAILVPTILSILVGLFVTAKVVEEIVKRKGTKTNA